MRMVLLDSLPFVEHADILCARVFEGGIVEKLGRNM